MLQEVLKQSENNTRWKSETTPRNDFPPPGGHLAMSRDVFGHHKLHRSFPSTKNHLAQNFNNAGVEKPLA